MGQDLVPVDCVENPADPDCFAVEPDCEGPDCFEPEVEEDNLSIFYKLVEWMNTMEQKIAGYTESLSSLEGEVATDAAKLAGYSAGLSSLMGEVAANSASLETLSSLEGEVGTMKSDIAELKSGQTTCEADNVQFGQSKTSETDTTESTKKTFSNSFVTKPALTFGVMKLTQNRLADVTLSDFSSASVTFNVKKAAKGALQLYYMACGHTR